MKNNISDTQTPSNMKEHSLEFNELRELGLEYTQELSGKSWTDYNAHDPGVTILEQLCYALTDIAYRTSLPVTSFLAPDPATTYLGSAYKNGFFTPSSVLTMHPVTENDLKKLLLDKFKDIENVWINYHSENRGEERMRGIKDIEILPKTNFRKKLAVIEKEKGVLKGVKYDEEDTKYKNFIKKVHKFLKSNRCLGEDVGMENITLLVNQDVRITIDIYISDQDDIYQLIANLFLALFEYIYRPIHRYSLDEMKADGYTIGEIFSGPKLKRGFIKEEDFKEKLPQLHIHELEKIILKVDGIIKCQVNEIISGKKRDLKFIEADKGSYLNILTYSKSKNRNSEAPDYQFRHIHRHLRVFTQQKSLERTDFSLRDKITYNVDRANRIIRETWSKKHRAFDLGSQDDFYHMRLKGLKKDPYQYHSIQHHFPTIYGLGQQEISKNEPNDRHAKVMQLKGYLLLFEQHLANHLAQLENMNEFFNIEYKDDKKTYFSQRLKNVPGSIDLLPLIEDSNELEKISQELLEDIQDTKRRIGSIYDHLLARFGESLDALPWKIYKDCNMISTGTVLNEKLLEEKSRFLLNIGGLYAHEKELLKRLKRNDLKKLDSYSLSGMKAEVYKEERIPSGLEKIVLLKTGIRQRENTITDDDLRNRLEEENNEKLIVDSDSLTEFMDESNKKKARNKFENCFRSLSQEEEAILDDRSFEDHEFTSVKGFGFGTIGLKSLFKEPLLYKNYLISDTPNNQGKFQVLFKKSPNKWMILFEAKEKQNLLGDIKSAINHIVAKNREYEGLFVVDHIMLRDIVSSGKYGFQFLTRSGQSHFRTLNDSQWTKTAEDRKEHLTDFFHAGQFKENIRNNANEEYWELVYPEVYKVRKRFLQILRKILDDSRLQEAGSKKLTFLFRALEDFIEELNAFDIINKLKNDIRSKIGKFKEQIQQLKRSDITFQILSKRLHDLKEEINETIRIKSEENGKSPENHEPDLYEKYSSIAAVKSRSLDADGIAKKEVKRINAILQETRKFTRLFHDTTQASGWEKLGELDKARMEREGNKTAQRRLVYQRKIPLKDLISSNQELDELKMELSDEGFEILKGDELIIDEDFFDLKATIILPDWPARFQNKRFKSYITDLVEERTPAHIATDIFWLDLESMIAFEDAYSNWHAYKYKDRSKKDKDLAEEEKEEEAKKIDAENRRNAFALYRQIIKFQKGDYD